LERLWFHAWKLFDGGIDFRPTKLLALCDRPLEASVHALTDALKIGKGAQTGNTSLPAGVVVSRVYRQTPQAIRNAGSPLAAI
jgi:hypothetical protein